jgi:CheY-like chemotaxis protein/nitrogen-specific signal transduction histidine kinase
VTIDPPATCTRDVVQATPDLAEALLRDAPLAAAVLDDRGQVRFWNRAAESLFGWKREELLGHAPPAGVAGCDRDSGTVRDLPVKGHRKNGEVLDLLVTSTPFGGGRLCYFADVTACRQLEVRLTRAQKFEDVGKLTGGIAHDFNNLLTVISGCSELLVTSMPADEPLRDLAAQIHQTAGRATSLTRQLVAFNSKQVVSPRVLDLNTVLGDVTRMLRRLIGEDIKLECELSPGLWQVRADVGQLEQSLLNLAVHAREAMPGGGTLKVATENVRLKGGETRLAGGDHVLLSVHGRGSRAEPRDREWRAGPDLHAVRNLVEQNRGAILADLGGEQGFSFQILLPRHAEPREARPTAIAPSSRRESGTLLVVEDEVSVRSLLCMTLRGAGFNVLEAGDGQQALLLGERFPERIDLVLTDIVMPGCGARELVRRLREIRPATQFLCMTGYSGDAAVHHGVLDGSVELLEKPFSRQRLLETVRETLNKPVKLF